VSAAHVLLALGAILAVSILADAVARRTAIPRISLLILVGIATAIWQPADTRPLGGLGEPLIQLALVMVAFLLGGELTRERLRSIGALVGVVSVGVAVSSLVIVGAGLAAVGYPLPVALALGAIAVATDPAAVMQGVRACQGEESLTGRVLKGVVAVDDAWGIIVFGAVMALLGWLDTGSGIASLGHAARELGGAVAAGVVLGLPAAWLTGRLRPGEPTQVEALALILIITGLSQVLAVSGLLLAMVTGAVIANVSPHHTRAFHEIEQIEWPFLVFFFVLSGASIRLDAAMAALPLLAAYGVCRLGGRLLGGWLTARWARRRGEPLPAGLGLALTPQAGVATGMALLAAERFPAHAQQLMATAVGGTVIFELIGPWLVQRVAKPTDDASANSDSG